MSQSVLLAATALSLAVAQPPPRTLGVFLFNFRNDDRQPASVEEIRREIFLDPDSTRAFYREQSYGLVDLVGKSGPGGDVFGWFTLEAFNRPCAETEWASAALAAAARAGVDTTGYDHLAFFFPATDACPYRGKGQHPGQQSWINGTSVSAFTHELGHNLGTPHASSRTCRGAEGEPVVLGGACTDVEYGNPFDVMGSGYRHTSAYNKAQAGWLPPANVSTIAHSGRYRLLPQEQAAAGPQLLALRRDATTFYYLEYRQPFGFDAFAPGDPITEGVLVSLGGALGEIASSFLLDLTPDTPTLDDARLGLAEPYRDEAAGLTLVVRERSSGAAEVEVTFDREPAADGGGGCQTVPTGPGGPGAAALPLLFALASRWRRRRGRGRASGGKRGPAPPPVLALGFAVGLGLGGLLAPGCGDAGGGAPPPEGQDAGTDASVGPPPSPRILLHPVAPAVASACLGYAESRCERLSTCSPNQLRDQYGDLIYCRLRVQEACRRDFSIPAQAESAAARVACAGALAAQTCRAFVLGHRLAACEPPAGTLAEGASCFQSRQCGPGLLCRPGVSPCGACRPAIPPGGDCGWWQGGCAPGTTCFDDRCLAPRQPGEACKTTPATCEPGSECTPRGCQDRTAERGASCASEDLCDHLRGVHCDLLSLTCAPWAPAVAIGGPCGTFTADGSVLTCVDGATCFGDSFTTRVCVASAGAGEPCDLSRGQACLAPAVCADGRCVVPAVVEGDPFTPPDCR